MTDACLPASTALPAGEPEILRPGWTSVVLICKACEKRRKGPKKLVAGDVARRLKKAAHEAGVPRPRIAMTGCLGACPKKAFTVAAASPGGAIRMVAYRRGDDPAAAARALLGERAAEA